MLAFFQTRMAKGDGGGGGGGGGGGRGGGGGGGSGGGGVLKIKLIDFYLNFILTKV